MANNAEAGRGNGFSRESGIIQTERRRLRFPHDRDFRILSLDGGGIKGIFAAALLARLELDQLGGESVGHYFDLVAGTSTGGLIALCLAAGKSAQDALKLYLDHGPEIFEPVSLRVLKAGYATDSLQRVAKDLMGDRTLGEAGLRLCIPAVNARRAEPCIFKTPHHPDYSFDSAERLVDVALATTAAPTFFKPHATEDYVLLDGGLIANNPVMVGLVDALCCYGIERRQVSILSIGTGARRPFISNAQLTGGIAAWHKIHDSFIYYADKNANGQAGLLIGRDRLVRIAPDGADAEIELTDIARAAERLPRAADAAYVEYSGAMAAFVRARAVSPDFFHGPRAVKPMWNDN